jgi:hypothetical protein
LILNLKNQSNTLLTKMESHSFRTKGKRKLDITQSQVSVKRGKAGIPELNDLELSTVDGGIVSQSARFAALKKGAGLMIGEYFVGVSTGADVLFSQPLVVY